MPSPFPEDFGKLLPELKSQKPKYRPAWFKKKQTENRKLKPENLKKE